MKCAEPQDNIILVIFSKHYCVNICAVINHHIATSLLIQESARYYVTLSPCESLSRLISPLENSTPLYLVLVLAHRPGP